MKAEVRAKLIERVKAIAGLTDDERGDLLELLRTQKTYGLVWEDKPEDVEERLRDELPVLIEDESKRLIDGGDDAPNHILIEGDNLEALTTLAYTHAGKIDVIYIDPPYNTGNKDFIYNDSYVDSEDTYRHSKWLSFMSKRLRIAKKLLSDRGVIFISIDDNEQANLKLLCDEVFGERNFIAKFDWRKKTGANDAKDIAIVTESILLYAKNRSITIEKKLWKRDEDSINADRYKFKDEFVEIRGRFYYDTLDRGGLQYSDSMNFGIKAPDGGIIYPHGRDTFLNDGWIWKWGREKVEWGIKNKLLEFVKSNKSKGSSYTIKYKVYQFVDNEGNIREKSGRAFMNLISEPINQIGNSEMKELFDNKTPFSNPKPIGLIRYLLRTLQTQNSTILDFFAGSGTTMHAVMQLNAEDGGHRQCILVTNNENGICENVTYERNKRVINGYTKPNGEFVEGLNGNNLRYFRTDFVGRSRSPQNLRKLVRLASDMLCIKEDLYAERQAFAGQEVVKQAFRYFEKGDKRMMVIYREEAVPLLVPLIEQFELPQGERIKVYVFSPSEDPWAGDFEDVQDKVELCALPMAILNAYKRVLPKRKDQNIFVEDNTTDEQETSFNDSLFTDEEGGEA